MQVRSMVVDPFTDKLATERSDMLLPKPIGLPGRLGIPFDLVRHALVWWTLLQEAFEQREDTQIRE